MGMSTVFTQTYESGRVATFSTIYADMIGKRDHADLARQYWLPVAEMALQREMYRDWRREGMSPEAARRAIFACLIYEPGPDD